MTFEPFAGEILFSRSTAIMFICMVVPLLLTSKKMCAGGFQITLFGRSGKEWFLSLELASNSCLEPPGSQLPEQRSPVRLVLLKHAKTNQSMFDRDACRRLPSVLISRTGFIFRYAHDLDFLLSLCPPPPPPSNSIFLFSSGYNFFSSAVSLSLSLPLFYLYLLFLLVIIVSRNWFTSSHSIWTLWIFSLLFFRISSNLCMLKIIIKKSKERKKEKTNGWATPIPNPKWFWPCWTNWGRRQSAREISLWTKSRR